MIAAKEFSRENFDHWIDIQPWMGPSVPKARDLSDSLELMTVKPSNTDEVPRDPNPTVAWELWEDYKDEATVEAELKEALMEGIAPLLD